MQPRKLGELPSKDVAVSVQVPLQKLYAVSQHRSLSCLSSNTRQIMLEPIQLSQSSLTPVRSFTDLRQTDTVRMLTYANG